MRSVWIAHGSKSAIGSIYTGMLFGMSITHWWAEIETTHAWYIAQFDGSFQIELTKKGSQSAATKAGLAVVGATLDTGKNITNKYTYTMPVATRTRTMKEVKNWVNKYDGNYHLVNNNCQHFAKALYEWI